MFSIEDDKEKLSEIGKEYADSFMDISVDGDQENDPDRLWQWMAKLINDVYQVGWKSGRSFIDEGLYKSFAQETFNKAGELRNNQHRSTRDLESFLQDRFDSAHERLTSKGNNEHR